MTVAVAPASELAVRLRDGAEAAFRAGLAQARAGRPVWRIGEAVERETRRRGLHVLRDLCGHGVGRAVHEEPTVANYPDRWNQAMLTENLVLTIEPIVSATARRSRPGRSNDGWTLESGDGSWTAHHEHTVLITGGEARVLTQ